MCCVITIARPNCFVPWVSLCGLVFVNFVLGAFFDHVTPIFRGLHWFPVAQRIQYKIAMLVNKCLQVLAPPYLAELYRSFISQDVDTCGRPPPTNSTCNGQPQPLLAGTLLFPVPRLGTVYQLNCVCRHCPLPSSILRTTPESASLRQH